MNVSGMRFARASMLAMLIVAFVALPIAVNAQRPSVGTMPQQQSSRWTVVRTAKWVLLGGAVGLGAYALHHSQKAEQAYTELREICNVAPQRCEVVGGHYADTETEGLFARSVAADRQAQVGIFGGQVALLGSVGLFIYDLRNGKGPRDIPYPAKRSLGVGLRVPF